MQELRGISIVIPSRNMEATIIRTLDSLDRQLTDRPVEILLVDNKSTDRTASLAQSHPVTRRWPVRVIVKDQAGSLASSYNLGWRNARHECVVFMHSDCYLANSDDLARLAALLEQDRVVGVMPIVVVPPDDWDAMSFWDKVSNARYVGQESHGLAGKFDAIRKRALTQIRGFDEVHYYSAGEDWDILIRLSALGRIEPSDVRVVHAHQHPKDATLKYIMRKQRQLGQGFGALWRIHAFRLARYIGVVKLSLVHAAKMVLLLCLLIPPLTLYSFAILFVMAAAYSWRVFFIKDWRVLLIPWVNIAQFAVFSWAVLVGFVQGKQSSDYR